jgi:hypothetical protein
LAQYAIEATRNYFVVANPGTFFRLAAPINQVVTLIAFVACWSFDTRVRYYLLGALVIAVATDAMTFSYFYPRNAIMFVNPMDGNTEAMRTAWKEWTLMNWLRSIAVAIGLFSILLRCFDLPGEWGDRMRDGLSVLIIHPRGQTASRHAYRP